MTIREMKSLMAGELRGLYNGTEIPGLIDFLMNWATGLDRLQLALDFDKHLSTNELIQLRKGLEALKHFEPVQYITGKAWFYNLEMEVAKGVLIPRPETEELVQWIIEDRLDRSGLKILDIGTGSGCIAVTLSRLMNNPEIIATDISEFALTIAERNAGAQKVPVTFILQDLLDPSTWPAQEKFDIIVSNPPYVRQSEKARMDKNVLDHEPAVALFVDDDDPLVFYRAIGEMAKIHLDWKGALYVEINEAFGKETLDMFHQMGFAEVFLRKDLRGKDRLIKALL